jgi:hypothetical protein
MDRERRLLEACALEGLLTLWTSWKLFNEKTTEHVIAWKHKRIHQRHRCNYIQEFFGHTFQILVFKHVCAWMRWVAFATNKTVHSKYN